MPWKVFKEGDKGWCIYKLNADDEQDGEAVHCHESEEQAEAQVAALYASEADKSLSLKAGRVIAGRNIERLRKMNSLMREVHAVMAELESDGAFALEDTPSPLTDMNAAPELAKSLEVPVAAPPKPPQPKLIELDPQPESDATLVALGGEIKAMGEGRIGGYLVRFSDAAQADLVGDFFTKATDFDVEPGERTRIYYQHGLDPKIKRRVIGQGALKVDDVGVWVEGQLKLRDAYERWVYSQVEQGKMGWSSGVPSHLVEREPEGKAFRVLSWPLGKDASITPTPCEPRNNVIPLKSVPVVPAVIPPDGAEGDSHSENESNPIEEDTTMAEIDYKALAAELAPLLKEATKPEPPPEPAPPVKTTEFAVPKQPEPEAFKSFGEFLQAVYGVAVPNGNQDKRLFKAASGLSEGVPSDGGFLVQKDTSNELLKRTYETGILVPRCRRIPISAASSGLTVNAIQESTRAASRWGGVVAYWQDEAALKSGTKPAFRQMELNLKKLTALCYATDELLQDATALEATIMSAFPEEMNFQMDDAIINGTGVGMPLGILNSPCLVSVTKETGQAADTVVAENIVKMWARMWGRSRANAVWLINQDIEPQLYLMYVAAGTGGVPVYMPAGGLSGQPFGTLFGRPVIPCEQCATLGDAGDIILGDFSQYLLIDKGGVNSASSIHIRFLYDETVYRFVYRADGQPTWNTTLTPYKGSATQSPFVVLAARA